MLRRLVELESPTTDKRSIDILGEFAAEQMRRLGATVTRYPQDSAGDHWLAEWGRGPGGILLLIHLDTVYPLGTLNHWRYEQDETVARGPGVLDMKASLAMALIAIEILHSAGRLPARRLGLLCTSDEEMGSRTSRQLVASLAPDHDLVLCLEPAGSDGALKTWRKGVGHFILETRGKAAHAGTNPENGINAILEMSHHVQRITAAADDQAGTTISVGTIEGGTRVNVVPESCRARIDVRVQSLQEQERIDTVLTSLTNVLPGSTLSVTGHWGRPPMPRTPEMASNFLQAKHIAAQLGITLSESGSGGGSDANLVAPLGIPVLDGLGAIGDSAHSEREHVRVDRLAERTALLAALITEWPAPDPAQPAGR